VRLEEVSLLVDHQLVQSSDDFVWVRHLRDLSGNQLRNESSNWICAASISCDFRAVSSNTVCSFLPTSEAFAVSSSAFTVLTGMLLTIF